MNYSPTDPEDRYYLIERQRRLSRALDLALGRWLEQTLPADFQRLLNTLDTEKGRSDERR